jgi:hypothetical protein
MNKLLVFGANLSYSAHFQAKHATLRDTVGKPEETRSGSQSIMERLSTRGTTSNFSDVAPAADSPKANVRYVSSPQHNR